MNTETSQVDDLHLVALPSAVSCAGMFVRFTLSEWSLKSMYEDVTRTVSHRVSSIVEAILARTTGRRSAASRMWVPSRTLDVSAGVSATQAFDYASKENIQTHGGMGFTWAVDCHFYYKRSKELGLALGPQRAWKDKLVTELELTNTAA